ncbi:hypothetical protein JAB5_01190 [Janthinobacterium sp. HH103]|nr:hypothetical protein JAB2_42640 [Janthinobacterium sp. HH100]OEZ89033.1 hypothetical protein JAB5_01190 [Janthinobacterium sp. HH103]
MPSITPMMSTILRELSWIEPMVAITCDMACSPLCAVSEAVLTRRFASRALSAFCLTVPVSSSMDDAVSSSALACDSVRRDRFALPAAISSAPRPTTPVDSLICPTSSLTFVCRTRSACATAVSSSLPLALMLPDRSPALMRSISPRMRSSGTTAARCTV